MMKQPWVGVLLLLAGCYSSAQAARVDQTTHADGFACVGEPAIQCPRGECTGWDNRWEATCPDDGSRWICRMDDGDVFCRARSE